MLAVCVLETEVDADTVFVLAILPLITELPDIDIVTLGVFDGKGLPVLVTLAVLVFDTSELLVSVTDAVVVFEDSALLVYEDVPVIVGDPVSVTEITGVLDNDDDIEGVGVQPALVVAVVVTLVVAECVRVGLIDLVEVAQIVGVLELLIDDVIVGLPYIVSVLLGVTVTVNRELAVFVSLVEADSVRDTRTLGELLGLDVTVLVACLEALVDGEEEPVLLDVTVFVLLTLAVPVFEDVLVEVVVDVILMDFDGGDDAVTEGEAEEVLDCFVDALDVPLTVDVFDELIEPVPVGDEEELFEAFADPVVVLVTVIVLVEVEEPVFVFVVALDSEIYGELDAVLDSNDDRVVVIVDVIVLVDVGDGVSRHVGNELRVDVVVLVDVFDAVVDKVGTAKFISRFLDTLISLLYGLATSTTDSLGGDDPISPMLNSSRNQRIVFYIYYRINI